MVYEKGGPGNTFSFHPFLMGIGFTLLLSLGFWMFNYEDLPGEWIDSRPGRRAMHITCQVTGITCVLMGYVMVVRAHREEGANLFQVSNYPPIGFPSGPSWLHLIHVLVGYFVIVLILCQVFVGTLKF